MGEPFLEVQKITKRFPGVVALSGVDLQVYPAEILALIGENGAGKEHPDENPRGRSACG